MFLDVIPQVLGVSTLKYCRRCEQYKPRESFAKSSSAKDGCYTYCKTCVNQRNAEQPQKSRDRARRWRENNPDAEKARVARYALEHSDELREYRARYRADAANAESARQRARAWYSNPENAASAKSRVKEYSKGPGRKYRRIASANRRARMLYGGGTVSEAQITEIRASQTDKRGRLICWACGKPILSNPELDHWIPLSKGGMHSVGNLHFMHRKCNRSKGAKHPTETGRLL